MWTNETKLIYSVERWPHNVTTTTTANGYNRFSSSQHQLNVSDVETMNKELEKCREQDDGPRKRMKRRRRGRKMKVDRRVKFTWIAPYAYSLALLLHNPIRIDTEQLNEKKRNEQKTHLHQTRFYWLILTNFVLLLLLLLTFESLP